MITDPIVDPDLREIRDVVRRFVRERFAAESVRAAATSGEGFDSDSWKLMVELGWTGLGISEEFGGAGLGVTEQCVLLSELGGSLAPVPFLSTAGLSVAALGRLASHAAAEALLPRIAEGLARSAVVLGCSNGWPGHGPDTVTARETSGGWMLTGHAKYCLDADHARPLLVIARVAGGYGLFGVDPGSADVVVRQVPTVDITRQLFDLVFDATPAEALHADMLPGEQVESVVDTMAVLLAAEATGAAEQCLTITLEYLRTRHQFGKPIGSFQALKHRCAEMAVGLTMAKELVFAAAATVDAGNGDSLRVAAPLALARAVEISTHIAEEGIQLHGGIGFTDEAAVGLYYKRALSDAELLAHSVDARARLARVLDRSASERQTLSRSAAA